MDPEASRPLPTLNELRALSTHDLWRLLFQISSILSLRMEPNLPSLNPGNETISCFFESGDGAVADGPSGSPDLPQRNPGGSAASDSAKAGGGSGARSRSRWNWRLEWTRLGGLAVKPKTGMSKASGMSIGFQTRTWWNSSAWFQSKRLLQRRKKTGPLQLNLFVSWMWINHSEFDKMRNHPN